jgi:hypothetical protein
MGKAPHFVYWRAADNARVRQAGAMGGWDQLRARLKGDATFHVEHVSGRIVEDIDPMLVFFRTCQHTIRTLPALQHDKSRAEDVDSDGEDHAADETRYACMSRPYIGRLPPTKEPPRGARTIEEMVRRYENRQQDYAKI